MSTLTVIKIGASIIDDKAKLHPFLSDFSKIQGYKILVHGGGKIASEFGTKLGIAPNYVAGRRVTDEQTLELVTMVYGGLINKTIVSALQALNCNALGLTGADMNIITAKKRDTSIVNYGHVGDIPENGVNAEAIHQLLNLGVTPVMASLTHDGNGNLLNTNADTIASTIAIAMSKLIDVQLIYGFEKDGVLLNSKDDSTVIPTLKIKDFDKLCNEGIISDGMLPKFTNACNAVKNGVKSVAIGNSTQIQDIISGKSGTRIV